MTVEWRKHPQYPEYELSSDGEIRSIYTMRPLGGGRDKDGYRRLVLCTGGVRVYARLATMVAETYIGPRPAGFVVRHLNGVRDDNRPANLEWSTQKDNIGDKVRHGTAQRGEKCGKTILTDEQARRIRDGGENAKRIAEELGVSTQTVYAIRCGRNWRYLG